MKLWIALSLLLSMAAVQSTPLACALRDLDRALYIHNLLRWLPLRQRHRRTEECQPT